MVLGTAILVVVLSVMNGFERELRLRILGVVPHLLFYPTHNSASLDWKQLQEKAEALPEIDAAAPWLGGTGMIIDRQTQGILLRGIEPRAEAAISVIDDFMVSGTLEDLVAGEFGLILGANLARSLAVTIGDRITIAVPSLNVNLAGIRPRIRRFEVKGLFVLNTELDKQLVLMHIEDAAALLKAPGPNALRVSLQNLFDAPDLKFELARAIESESSNLYPVDWSSSYGSLFAAVQLERRLVAMLLFLIVVIAAFNILASLVMAVDSRKAEIAILRTIGATKWRVARIFLLQGIMIGLVGIVTGLSIGLAIAFQLEGLAAWFDELRYAYSGERLFSAYFVHYLPSEVNWSQIPIIAGSALLISCLSAIFPALRAMKLQPAQILRYE